MNSIQNVSPPKWFWVLCGILFIWNLLGVMAFFQQILMTAEQLNAMDAAERSLYMEQPLWVSVAFACAVFGGTLGTLALMVRNALAKPILIISLFGVVIQMAYNFLIANTVDVYGPGAAIMPAMVLLIAIFLVWFTAQSIAKGWVGNP